MKSALSLLLLLLAGTNLLVFAQEDRHHGAHEHGTGRLDIAMDGAKLYVELNSPAANIVGYEHAPNSNEDHEVLERALAQLNKGSDLFTLPRAAGCELVSTDVDTALADHDDEHHAEQDGHAEHDDHSGHHDEDHSGHHDEDHDGEEAHSDITATWLFDCMRPEALDRIKVRLFEVFLLTNRLQVQFITENRQGSATLNSSKPEIRF